MKPESTHSKAQYQIPCVIQDFTFYPSGSLPAASLDSWARIFLSHCFCHKTSLIAEITPHLKISDLCHS